MALEFEAAAAAPTPPLVITGTPYYFAMFNAAGNNVADSQMFTVAGGTLIAIKQPNGAIASTFSLSNTPDANAFSMFWLDANLYIGVETDQCIVRLGSTDTNKNATVGYDKATEIPYFSLFDGSGVAVIQYDSNELAFIVVNGDGIRFEQASAADNVSIVFGTDDASINTSNTSGAYAQVRSNGTTSQINAYDSTEDNYLDIVVEAGATNTYISLFNDAAEIFRADSDGISTDGTNFIKFLAASATAPTPDSKIEVIVNGVTYLIAAELVP